ncbi:hypothetical protein ACHAWC_009470 [Mediolabrus comicus]
MCLMLKFVAGLVSPLPFLQTAYDWFSLLVPFWYACMLFTDCWVVGLVSGGFVLLLHFLRWIGQVLRPPKPRRKWGGSRMERKFEKFRNSLSERSVRSLSGKRWRKRQRALREARLLREDTATQKLFRGRCYFDRAAVRRRARRERKKCDRWHRVYGGYRKVPQAPPHDGYASEARELFKLDKLDDGSIESFVKDWADWLFGEETEEEKETRLRVTTRSSSSMPQKESPSSAVDGFSFGSVMGQLLYLAGLTRPDIAKETPSSAVEADVPPDDWSAEGYASPSDEVFRVKEHDDDMLDELVRSIDDPSKAMASFLAMTPAQHARNVETLLLRANFAELLFNESSRTLDPQLQGCPACPRGKGGAATQGPPTDSKYWLTPCIVDTGASFGLTPFRSDFLCFEECELKVKAVAHTNIVTGFGLVLIRMRASNGDICLVPCISYLMEECSVRLMSPQSYHQVYQGHSALDGIAYHFFLAQAANGNVNHRIEIPMEKGSNLPMIFECATTAEEKERARPYFEKSLRLHQHFCGEFFGAWKLSFDPDEDDQEEVYEFTPFQHLSTLSNCVTSDDNPNLTLGQKELLLWSYRLQCSPRRVQHLMQSHTRTDAEGQKVTIAPVIPVKHPDALTCSPDIKCATREVARATIQKRPISRGKRDQSQDKALSRDKYAPGDYVSMDTVPVGIPGRAYNTYGGPNAKVVYTHFTIFHDAASGVIQVYLQEDDSAASTLFSKARFERFMWDVAGVTVKEYHSDQGSNFISEPFRDDCKSKGQSQSFSGTGAKFENGAAERAVKTVMWMARSQLLHCSLRWDKDGTASPSLWPMAVEYSVWLFNRTPKMDTCYSPLELLTCRRSDHRDLLRSKVWGCPCYVLEAKLQDGHKLPKFSRRSRIGQFMGMSPEHSSLIGRVRSLRTGSITNQFHVIYDERFESVMGLVMNEHLDELEQYVVKLWEELFHTDYARDFYVEPEMSPDGDLVYEVPPLLDEWLTKEELREKEEHLQEQARRDAARLHRYEEKFKQELRPRTRTADRKVTVRFKDEPAVKEIPATDDSTASVPSDDKDAIAEVSSPVSPSEGEGGGLDSIDEPEFDEDVPGIDFDPLDKPADDDEGEVWTRRVSRRSKGTWKDRYDGSEYVQYMAPRRRERITAHNFRPVLDFSPSELCSLSLEERAVLRNPHLSREYNVDFSYLSLTLQNERQMPCHLRHHPVTLDPVRHPSESAWINLLQHRQRCHEQAAVDLNYHRLEEVAPTLEDVVNSPLMPFITLSTNNTVYSGSVTELVCQDVHPAFLSAKTGISKADNPSWDEAMKGPEAAEYWKAAELEVATLEKMRSWDVVERPKNKRAGLMLEKESDAAGFLGVKIDQLEKDADGNVLKVELTQCGLIDRIIANLGLEGDKQWAVRTPAESSKPLVRDENGAPCLEDFSYASVVGQLLYLAGHTRPDIAYAVNQCARYMFNPKRSHELALIRIGKYLKGTRTKGIIFKPSGGMFNINAFPDADFAGLYGHEHPADPACVKSRTGFVITIANCPIMWKSSLQSKTALSTMEAEITALAHCMKELLSIMNLAKMFAEHYDLAPVKTKMSITIHEDNSGALVLANTIPPESTPRSKFYHLETVWFREQIVLHGIDVVEVSTTEQLGDIFTKGLTRVVFEYLRKKLLGW